LDSCHTVPQILTVSPLFPVIEQAALKLLIDISVSAFQQHFHTMSPLPDKNAQTAVAQQPAQPAIRRRSHPTIATVIFLRILKAAIACMGSLFSIRWYQEHLCCQTQYHKLELSVISVLTYMAVTFVIDFFILKDIK
jgi:hypothetical protein